MSRWTLARRLQEVAMRIAAGKPVKLGRATVVVPDRVVLEEELERTADGEMELEFEVRWSATPPRGGARTRRRARS